MSLLDGGPDVIEWFEEIVTADGYGTPTPAPSSAATAVFTAQVQRVSSTEAADLGFDTREVYSFQTSRVLQGAKSGLTVNGRRAEVLAPPLRQGRSPRTASTRVRFRYVA